MTTQLTNTAVFDRPYDPETDAFATCRKFKSELVLTYGPFELARRPDGTATVNLTHRLVHHSPDGFEWGYGGSGPGDLALNMLAEFVLPWEAWRLHQPFKWAVIARVPQAGGATITRDSVARWIERVWAHEDQLGKRPDCSMCITIAKVSGCLDHLVQREGGFADAQGGDDPPAPA